MFSILHFIIFSPDDPYALPTDDEGQTVLGSVQGEKVQPTAKGKGASAVPSTAPKKKTEQLYFLKTKERDIVIMWVMVMGTIGMMAGMAVAISTMELPFIKK